jgi:peptidoglycan/xylan/chitin deacetylase (PgdA/CDA1 family)
VGSWCLGVAIGAFLLIAGILSGASVLIAAGALFLALTLVAGHRFMRLEPSVPVLVWHSVSDDAEWLPWADNISVRPHVFDAQMQSLARWGWQVIGSRDLGDWMDGIQAHPIPPKSVVLHFDDGYRDNALVAVPILRKLGFPATIFIATDFIAKTPREDGKGYLSASELRSLDSEPLIEIACHGRDHGRLPVAGPTVGRFSLDNWRMHAPLIWGRTEGDKSTWFEADTPVPFSYGDPVPASDSSLTARWLKRCGTLETEAAQATRVETQLREARETLEAVLGRPVDHLCWPFDRVSETAVSAAQRAGFSMMTAGRGYNRRGTSASAISRIHVTDRAIGGGPLWTELAVFRAKLNVAAGNLYWMPLVWLAAALRARRIRKPFDPLAGGTGSAPRPDGISLAKVRPHAGSS